MHDLYRRRCNLAFRHCRYFKMVSDSSRFSSRDTLVSVLYGPEVNVSCYLANQVLKQPAKLLAPDELRLDSRVEQLAAQRKIDRLVSYRFIQGISNQPRQLSDGRVTPWLTERWISAEAHTKRTSDCWEKSSRRYHTSGKGSHNPILTGLKRSSWLFTWAMKKTLVV